jgi:hypothetical protein
MEIMPKPVGVMTSSVATSANVQIGQVAMSGLAGGFSNLDVGLAYYGTTTGELISDGVHYGRDGASHSNEAVDGYFYVTDPVTKTMVSADSQIGIAVSANTLLIRLV